MEYIRLISHTLSAYALYYPIFMTHVWLFGSLIFYWKWERNTSDTPPAQAELPVSILLPCHNEGENLRETIHWLLKQNYSNFEIIAINDGSKDNTGAILDELAFAEPRLRTVHFSRNQGKAMGLRMGAMISRNEILVCIDGDAVLHPDALRWIMPHFINSPRVGAVTGNPRVRNRSTLLGKIQVGEFSCIIGMIKRAQRVFGRVFSVSGVLVAFRKTALHQCGYWSTDMVTEDVDITWKLQRNYWDIRFEPNAKCFIWMPETLRGLWHQRLRWAQGGAEVLLKNVDLITHWKARRMWPILIEAIASILWVYSVLLLLILSVIGYLIDLPFLHAVFWLNGHGPNMLLLMTALLQFGVGLFLDRRYERGLMFNYFWIIWYPLVYWIISAATAAIGFPKAILKKQGQRATWVSPDRGFKP